MEKNQEKNQSRAERILSTLDTAVTPIAWFFEWMSQGTEEEKSDARFALAILFGLAFLSEIINAIL